MRIQPIAIALLLTSISAFSQDRWKLVLDDGSEKVYLDTTNIEKTAQGYLVFTRTVFPKPISIPQAGKGKPLGGVVSFVNHVEYTIQKQQSRHRWFYDKRGNQLWNEDVIASWYEFAPESGEDWVSKAVFDLGTHLGKEVKTAE